MSKINRQDRFRFRAWCDYTSGDHMSSQAGKKYMIDSDALENDPELTMMLKDEIDCVLMQCTGLRDKNGVLIFEGNVFGDEYGTRCLVKWDNDYALFVLHFPNSHIEHCIRNATRYEPLGNIYENPELLEQ